MTRYMWGNTQIGEGPSLWGAFISFLLGKMGLGSGSTNNKGKVDQNTADQLRRLGIPVSKTGEVPNFLFRAAPLKALKTNPSQMFNNIKSLEGATLELYNNSGTETIAAANTKRIDLWNDVLAEVGSIATSTDQYPNFKAFRLYGEFNSASPFVLMPFVVVTENGETIAGTNYNGDNALSAILASLPAQERAYFIGPAVKSTGKWDGGTVRHYAVLNFEMRDLANMCSAYIAKKRLEEENTIVVQLGMLVHGIASQTVNYLNTRVRSYAMEARGLVF